MASRSTSDWHPFVCARAWPNDEIWEAFEAWRRETGIRLVLATTTGSVPYTQHAFRDGDCLLMGRESAGVPEAVHAAADARVVVPIRPGLRSLNVAVCAAMMLGEAIRQVG